MPSILKRLNKRLEPQQREEVKDALLEYAVDNEYTAKDLAAD